MSRYPNGDYVVVSGGHMSFTHPSFGQDLSRDEAIQRIKDLMSTNNSLQEALKKNTELLRTFVPRITEMEAQQKQKDDMIEVYRQQAKQLITDLRQELDTKNAILSQLDTQGQMPPPSLQQQRQEYEARIASAQQQQRQLEEQMARCQRQIEQLRQEKAGLLEDNQALRANQWTVVNKEEESRLVEGKDTENSSTIPLTVEGHRVTTESIATETTTETIYDDVEVPEDKDKNELNLQIEALNGKVVELTAMLREKEMELHEAVSGRTPGAGAACVAGGQAEENLQRERAQHRHREQMLMKQIKEFQQQVNNIGDGNSDVMTLRLQVQQLMENANNNSQQLSIAQSELAVATQEKQKNQNEITSLQQQIQNYRSVCERQRQEIEKLKEEAVNQEDQYQQLVTDHHRLLQSTHAGGGHGHRDSEEVDRLTAQVISLEQGLENKKTENQKLENEIRKLKAEIGDAQVFKAQAEIYKTDFDAERQARELMNTEKVRLEEELQAVQYRNQELQDEIQQLSQHQITEAQRSYASTANRPYQYPPPRNPQVSAAQSVARPTQMTAEQIFQCPLCKRVFPDCDSLQVHCMDCEG